MSIKLNFLLNTTRLFLSSFSLLIILPYTTRILGSLNLGKIEYVSSIINYFLLFTALGIPYYGVREVSRNKNEKKNLTEVTMELLIILTLTTLIGYIFFFVFLFNSKNLKGDNLLFLIMSLNIVFSNLGVEWFYQGIENQKYITIRFIIIKIITIISLFVFVRDRGDYIKYVILLLLMNSGSNIFNLFHLRKYVEFKNIKIKNLKLKRHLKPVFVIFIASIAKSIYLQLDVVMLGTIKNPENVAYYTVANKLIRMILLVVTALGTVMLPRLIDCLKKNNFELYKIYSKKSLKYILMLAVPSFFGTFLLAEEIILLIAGNEFLKSAETMKIIAIIIVIVGLANYIGHQVLYVNGLERYYTYTVVIAAVINFVFNYIFIPKYAENGAAFGTVLAELIGVLVMFYFARYKLREVGFYEKENLNYFYAALIMGVIVYFLKKINFILYGKLFIIAFLGALVYFSILVILKDSFTIEIMRNIELKIKKYLNRFKEEK